MATIIKRNGSYRVQVSRKGIRKSATFDTKAQAEIWAYQMEAMILNNETEDQKIIYNDLLTVVDVFQKYKNTVSPKKRGFKQEKNRIDHLCKDSTFLIPVNQLTNKVMASWRDQRLTQVQPSTVNRELIIISTIINTAIKEWGVELPNNPIHMIQRPRNSKARDQRISEEEKLLIVNQLGWDMKCPPKSSSQWTAFAFCLALETAMRRGELCAFTWGDLHLDKSYLHLEITKNGDERDVPLSSKAKALLQLLTPKESNAKVISITPDVITVLFGVAKNKVGLKHIRFHDARREATTQLSKKLSNVLELSALTGHKDLQTLKRYYKPKAIDIAKKLD